MELIEKAINASIATKQAILGNRELLQTIASVSDATAQCLNSDGKVLFCGNGGSAADAQHLAAELSGRFYFDREPLFGEALHVNTSYLTAVGNDYGYDEVYSRLVRAKGRKGDALFCISTSGNSANIIAAAKQATELGMLTVSLTGQSGGALAEHCTYKLNVPSDDTPRIQEAHILIGHIICEAVELALFPK